MVAFSTLDSRLRFLVRGSGHTIPRVGVGLTVSGKEIKPWPI